jgi:hypothetical protein
MNLEDYIRTVPDFPQEGVNFRMWGLCWRIRRPGVIATDR